MKRSLVVMLVGLVMILTTVSSLSAQTVVRYSRWAGGTENDMFSALVDKFNQTVGKQKNIVVQFEGLPWSAYWDKMRTTILAGNAPDVISLSNAGEQGAYLTRNVFANMSAMSGYNQVVADLTRGAVESLKVNGRSVGLPVGLGVRAMIYNKDLLRAAGIPEPSATVPMTWEDLVAMSAKLTKRDAQGNVTQYTALFQFEEMTDAIVGQWGGSFVDNRNRPTRVTLNNAAGIGALNFIVNELYKKGVVPPETGEWQTSFGNPDSAVGTGKVAFMHTGPWGFDALVEGKINFGTAPLPIFRGKANNRQTPGYINGLAIYKGSKVQTAAWEFVKWLVSVEGQLEFTKTGDLPANTRALAQAQTNAQSLYGKGGKIPNAADLYRAYFAELPFVISSQSSLPSGEWKGAYSTIMTDMRKFMLTPAAAAQKLQQEGNAIFAEMFD